MDLDGWTRQAPLIQLGPRVGRIRLETLAVARRGRPALVLPICMAPSQPDGTSDASDLSETVWFRDGAASTYRLTVSTSRFRVVPAVYGILAAEGRGPRAEGRVLVMRRAGTGYRAGQLGLPAGHLDGGEDAVSGLLRELREELAVTVNRDSCHLAVVCHRAPEHPGDGEYLDMFFTVDVWHGTPVIAEPDKCSELVWADRTHLPPDVVDYVAAALTAVDRGERLLLHGWR